MTNINFLKSKFKKIKSKLTVIDGVFFVILLSVLAIFFLYTKRNAEFISLKIRVTNDEVFDKKTNIRDEYASVFYVGDSEKGEFGNQIVTITDIESYQSFQDEKEVILTLRAKTVYNKNTGKYTMRGRPIVYGQSFTFYFTQAKVEGIVIDFPGFEQQYPVKEFIISTEYRYESRDFSDVHGAPPYIANLIQSGQIIYDSKSQKLLEVLDVIVEPAKRTVVTASGDIVIRRDPILKDISYILKVRANRIDGNYYFLYSYPLKVGASIPLHTDKASLWPVITDIQEI